MLEAALGGIFTCVLVAGVLRYVRRKIRKAIHDDNVRRARAGDEEVSDRPICLYSAHDPLNAGITRISRGRQ